jgi:hypothetical protein
MDLINLGFLERPKEIEFIDTKWNNSCGQEM